MFPHPEKGFLWTQGDEISRKMHFYTGASAPQVKLPSQNGHTSSKHLCRQNLLFTRAASRTPFLRYAFFSFFSPHLLAPSLRLPSTSQHSSGFRGFLADTASQISIMWLWTTSSNNQNLVLRMKVIQLSYKHILQTLDVTRECSYEPSVFFRATWNVFMLYLFTSSSGFSLNCAIA